MHILEMSTARKVADAIKEERNPAAQIEAKRKRAQWLFEAEPGTLKMSTETRELLEQACLSEENTKPSVDDLNREFLSDCADFVDVSVGAATWVNAAGKFFVEADYRVRGEVWRVHKGDSDPYPSNPHAHCIDGSTRFIGCTLHLGTAKLYRKRDALGRFLDRSQFDRLLELIGPKFPGVKFPLGS